MNISKVDPRDKLTDFITTGDANSDEKTRVLSKEQLAFYYAYMNLGAEPGLEFFRHEAERDMRLCMSIAKIGSNRAEQVVEMFKALDESTDREVGLGVVTDYNKARRKGP